MDARIKNGNGNFSLRAAALIIENGQILLAKSNMHDCFYTVGGGINQNEASDKAILRECYEETGYYFEIDRLVFVQERFYTLENMPHHEVTFFYLILSSIKSLIKNMGISVEQAMSVLEIPEGDRQKYLDLLEQQ